jgi:hypothetical protein
MQASKVTLSGLLNFTDGLWSCCGSERIIIFTTNYVDKLDPALLRAGWMDKRILMSWCKFPAFRTLARNNLGLEWHDLFPQIEEAMEALAKAPLVSEKPPVKTLDFDEINLFAGAVDVNNPPVAEDADSGSESASTVQPVEEVASKDTTPSDVKESKTE